MSPAATPAVTTAPSPSPSTIPPLQLVGLGDSIPGALGCFCRPYPSLYGDAVSKALGRSVNTTNLATNDSLESGELLERVRTTYAAQIAAADIVTMTIGGNDWAKDCEWLKDDGCWVASEAMVGENIRATLAEILELRAGKPTAIRVTTYYNSEINDPDAPAGPEFQALYLRELKKFNALICKVAEAGGAICIDLLPVFNGPNGAQPADQYFLHMGNIHLNQAGQALVAQAIAAAGFAPLD